MRRSEIYELAKAKWGIYLQLAMAIEEMAELTQAIIRFQRNPMAHEKQNLEDEIADVEIMMEQLRLIFDSKRISIIKHKKIKRLERRIEGIPNGAPQ